MTMNIQNLISFCQFVLKILSKMLILSTIMCIQNLVSICLFVFRILSKNSILTLIKGRNSIANLPKLEPIQAFMHVLVTCKNEEEWKLKMKVLDCSQDLFHYKSMGFFQTLKGSLLCSPRSDLVKFRTRPRLYGCPTYLQK